MRSYESILQSGHVFRDAEIQWAVQEMAQLPDTNSGWRSAALCQKLSPELFDDANKTDALIELAKRACQTCTVMNECLNYVLKINETSLILGGMTPDERRALRRRATRSRR